VCKSCRQHLSLFLHLHIGEYRRETHMKFKKKELLLGVLLGTGLQLLNNLREHLPDHVDEIKDRARERYDRLGRATNVLRGKEESRRFGKVGVLLIGVGVGLAGTSLISRLAQWPTLVSGSAIALAFSFSAAVGIVFGFYPAKRAAALDPITALRSE